MPNASARAAQALLEVVPAIMLAIRTDIRGRRPPGLSVPQFRTLAFLNRTAGASLSEVAEHIGLALPSMSKLVNDLVVRKLVTRATHARDRRRAVLRLTRHGGAVLDASLESTRAFLARRLSALPKSEHLMILQTLDILRVVFKREHPNKSHAHP